MHVLFIHFSVLTIIILYLESAYELQMKISVWQFTPKLGNNASHPRLSRHIAHANINC